MSDSHRGDSITLHPQTSTEKELELERLLSEDPGSLHVKKTLAFAYYTKQKYQKAMRLYYQLAVEALDDPAVHFYMGNTLFRMRNYRLAIISWRKTLEKDTDGAFSKRVEERISMANEFIEDTFS